MASSWALVTGRRRPIRKPDGRGGRNRRNLLCLVHDVGYQSIAEAARRGRPSTCRRPLRLLDPAATGLPALPNAPLTLHQSEAELPPAVARLLEILLEPIREQVS